VVACLSAISWAFITPPFEAPDEPAHFAYVKQLAETGTLPITNRGPLSNEEEYALQALKNWDIRFNPAAKAVFSQAEQRELGRGLEAARRSFAGEGSRAAGVAAQEPPLYYALESGPYLLGSDGTLLDRLQLMRLLSALMAGATALFTFLFLRETLPRVRWAWTVGALSVALCPMFGFMSGVVNPDAMLFAVCAALFYCIARALRRGLTMRSAAAFGLVVAAGFLTKLNFIGLAPGAFLALAILAVRGARAHGRRALLAPAAAAAIGLAPVVLFIVHNILSGGSALGIVANAIGTTHGSAPAVANYVWQLYLPRLPGTTNDFPGLFTTRQLWFDGYVGEFGWLDTFFPGWVYTLALIPALLTAALCARALLASRAALRACVPELAVYAVMAFGLIVLIGVDSYREFPELTASYGQVRYLLPLLPLLGAVIALAARGAGRRWGPAAGALIVVLFFAHDMFSQLQVIARYYA
jgi:4-amino-4-deoxy-L-arabinose transferase-like glycosyltransferase